MDPYDGESLKTIADLTLDPDSWVALNALASLEQFGPKLKDHLPKLKEIAASKIKQNADRAKKLIPKIEAALKVEAMKEFGKREKLFREQAELAREFVDRVRGI